MRRRHGIRIRMCRRLAVGVSKRICVRMRRRFGIRIRMCSRFRVGVRERVCVRVRRRFCVGACVRWGASESERICVGIGECKRICKCI